MKQRDIQQLKEQSIESLKKEASEVKNQINNLKAELYAGREKNVKKAWKERRKLAVIKTLIKEKELQKTI